MTRAQRALPSMTRPASTLYIGQQDGRRVWIVMALYFGGYFMRLLTRPLPAAA